MNLMNLNERVLRHGESICFVGKFGLIFWLLGVVSGILNKTNASAAPKIQFIEVHLLHLMMITRTLLYKLMNLMNFNELIYYLRILFAMDKRARHVFWLGQVHLRSFGSLKKVMTMRKIFFLLSALVLTGCGLLFCPTGSQPALKKRCAKSTLRLAQPHRHHDVEERAVDFEDAGA